MSLIISRQFFLLHFEFEVLVYQVNDVYYDEGFSERRRIEKLLACLVFCMANAFYSSAIQ